MTSSINSISTNQQDWAALMAQRMQAKMDSDKNGSISKSEFSAIMDTASASQSTSSTSGTDDLFSSMDANSDGSIDSTESESYLKKIQEEMLSMFNSVQASSQMQPPPPPPSGGNKGKDMFSDMDTDSSGSVSKSELTAFMTKGGMSETDVSKIFDQVDTDGNGEINETEHEAQLKKMDKQHGVQASAASTSSDFTQTLLDAIKANATSSNKTKTAINQLLSQLKSGLQYSQTGGTSFGSSMQSLFNLTA